MTFFDQKNYMSINSPWHISCKNKNFHLIQFCNFIVFKDTLFMDWWLFWYIHGPFNVQPNFPQLQKKVSWCKLLAVTSDKNIHMKMVFFFSYVQHSGPSSEASNYHYPSTPSSVKGKWKESGRGMEVQVNSLFTQPSPFAHSCEGWRAGGLLCPSVVGCLLGDTFLARHISGH